MLKKLLLFLVMLAPLAGFSQGCITIFSEDGDRFQLYLNSVPQNPTPQANVRVDGLMNDYYSARIVFEDKSKPEIKKNLYVKDAGTNALMEMTYKVKKAKDGEMKLRFFGATPMPVSYTPTPDMFYVHFGQAAAPAPSMGGQTTTTTTTTTMNTTSPDAANINVNAGGVNVNLNVQDPTNGGMGGVNMNVNMNGAPMMSGNVTTSQTTTRTTTTTSQSYDEPAPAPVAAQGGGCGYPMSMTDFAEAKKTIGAASFEDTKLSTAKTIISSNCLSTDQVIQICKMFSYEASKLDFAKTAYGRTTDRGNYFKVANIFSFDASKTELNEFISH